MAQIMVKGSPTSTSGSLPAVGSVPPDFVLVDGSLSDRRLRDWAGKTIILNIVTSLDTSTCAVSAKKFDSEAGKLPGVVVLTVSCDLPFAQGRFCKTEGVSNVITLSQMRDRAFGKDYGVEILDGPLAGLFSRSVVVIGADGRVKYTEQVPENSHEPDYGKALAAAR